MQQHAHTTIKIQTITTTTTTTNTTIFTAWNDPGKPVSKETFTHSHLSWSSIILYQLPPSTMIHSILPVQFTCLTVFLPPSPLWSTSWSGTIHFILHTFLHSIIVFFLHTCPHQRSLLCCSTEIISSNPSLSLNSLHGTLSITLTPHIYLTILVCVCCNPKKNQNKKN